MTRRERVLTSLSHKEPDKIPVDCGAMRSTGLSGKAYNDIKRHLGVAGGETLMYDMVQQLAIPEEWYLEKFQVDIVDLSRAFADQPEEWVDWQLPDNSPVKIPNWLRLEKRGTGWFCIDDEGDTLAAMPEGSYFFDQVLWPLLGKDNVDYANLPSFLKKIMWVYMTDPMWKHAGESGFYDLVREKAKKLYDETDYAIMAGFGGQLFELGCYLYRHDGFLENLLLKRKEMESVLDKLVEMHLAVLGPFVKAISPYVQVIVMGDDLGTQNGPMISPKLYKEIFFPRHKEMYQFIKNNSKIKVFLHSCGSISEFIPDLIDAGVDIINPVQISAKGMDARKLKREYGRDLAFWGGGVDTQHILRAGTEEEVRTAVRTNSEIFMKDGGFIFNQVHNVLPGVPPQNVLVMYDEVNKMKY